MNLPTSDFGVMPDVVTNHQFEEIAAKGKITRPSDGKAAKSVVFIQSPGKETMTATFLYRFGDQSGGTQAGQICQCEDYLTARPIFFTSICATPGLLENFYKSMPAGPGIFMTKGEVIGVSKNGDGLIVEADDTLLGEKVQVKADMVVLATGMVPVTKDDPVVNLAYRQGPAFRVITRFLMDMQIPIISAFPMKPSEPAFTRQAPSDAA
jgi:quinone-modifying oxidoreductase, subunit QmoB